MTDNETPKTFRDKHFKGMSADQYAEWLEENVDEQAWGPTVEAEISKNLTSVVSVRFNKGELAVIVAAAERNGVKPSTFIREVVLSQVTRPKEVQQNAEILVEHRDEVEEAISVLWNFAERASHLRGIWSDDVPKEPLISTGRQGHDVATKPKKKHSKRKSAESRSAQKT